MENGSIKSPLLGSHGLSKVNTCKNWSKLLWFSLAFVTTTAICAIYQGNLNGWVLREENKYEEKFGDNRPYIVESEHGVVAADDSRCSEVGASILRQGGHAVDAAVATILCEGVVNAVANGIGGGAFMIVRSSRTLQTQAFDMRETAPLAASKDMYASNSQAKYRGALSMAVPGEIAGLYEAWLQHGRLPWRTLFQPAIKLAKDFVVAPYLGSCLAKSKDLILSDPGLKAVYAPYGKVLQSGEMCHNVELARSLEAVATEGPQAFYNGTVGEKLVKDVRKAGGILTMEDLRSYKVKITDAMSVNASGYTMHGMPPPSLGTAGLSLVLNVFNSYASPQAANGSLGLHRLIEALKHMTAIGMNLGDPDFVNIIEPLSKMLSPYYAEKIRERIVDDRTFPSEYYMNRWRQLRDHGTSHICIVDADRNAVSMTSTVNYGFGAGVLSPSTGIVLNDEMGDFSIPTELSPDMLPPSPSNFIEPKKRPLSSMTPIIITKGTQLVGVIGGSGGTLIIPAVIQVFLNHFILGMDPLDAVLSPRIYQKLIPNVVLYENWTVIDGDHIELPKERRIFLEERGHQLVPRAGGAIVQFIVQNFKNPIAMGRKVGKDSHIVGGKLTAVSDPRKDGKPAAV